jgi:hypothetical protein
VEPYPTYSVVIPIHDEQSRSRSCTGGVDVFPQLDGEVEVLFVDDGSTVCCPVMLELHAAIHASRSSISPGISDTSWRSPRIRLAHGDAVVVMDGDLQHPRVASCTRRAVA